MVGLSCPNCDNDETFGVMEKDGEIVRGCDVCGYVEEASPSEIAMYEGVTTGEWPEPEADQRLEDE